MKRPSVRIVEVGPRDGLQAIQETVPTDVKIELIRRLSRTGLRTIEVTSFTSKRWIPQLADHQTVLKAVLQTGNATSVDYSVLVPNLQGLLAAAAAGAKEVGVFVSATEGFSRSNNNCTVQEALGRAKQVAEKAAQLGIRTRGYVSCIISCPFDGPVDPSRVLEVARALLNAGCYEVSLGDTLGVGTPVQIRRLLGVLLEYIPAHQLAGHFHDTYGQAVANTLAAYELGLRTFDSSVGGLGGCPYSPGAKGNLSTEDIVYTLEQMGITTGVDLNALADIGHWINAKIGKVNSSRAGEAIYSKQLTALSQNNSRSQTAAGEGPSRVKPAVNLDRRPEAWTLVNEDPEYQLFRRRSTVKIVLNRPRNGNALTRTMLKNLRILFETLSKDTSVFHIVLTANGKYFCTGMDLSTGGATAEAADSSSKTEQFDGLYRLFEAIDRTPQTTLALINGPTYGGGTGLAFVCDIRLARSDVFFVMTEVKLGLCPATISKFVIREWGLAVAREAMLTARPTTAQKLYNIGVIHGLAAPLPASSSASNGGHDPQDNDLEDYLDRYLRYVAPQAAAHTKDLVAAAWRYTGDGRQDKVIKDVFEWMIASCDEARVGTDAFRAGKKGVDWHNMYKTQKLAGDGDIEIKSKL